MSNDDHIRFRFEHGDLEVDISGPRSFVESLSREVMRDVGDVIDARPRPATGPDADPESVSSAADPSDRSAATPNAEASARIETPHTPATRDPTVVWMIRTGPLMQRIFMAEVSVIDESAVGGLLRSDVLHSVFASPDVFDRLFGDVAAASSTVWGKLTDAGKQRMDRTDTDSH